MRGGKIIVTRLAEPDIGGWHDVISIVDRGRVVYSGMCSISPNPFRPSDNKPWWEVYGALEIGREYTYHVEPAHPRFGKCLLINRGEPVGAMNPNPNHGGKRILTEIFIHCANVGGVSDQWRGSAGCITIPRHEWEAFIAMFGNHERGEIWLR